jgi:hypothetical protein
MSAAAGLVWEGLVLCDREAGTGLKDDGRWVF